MNKRHNAGHIIGIGGKLPVATYRAHFLLNGVAGDWERYVLAANLGPGVGDVFADGLISPSFFVGHDIDFDLPEHKIILYFPMHDCSSASAFLNGPLTAVPLEHPEQKILDSAAPDRRRIASFLGNLLDASPRISLSIGGKTLIAGVDSGAPHNILFLSGAQKIGLTADQIAKDKPTLAFGIGQAPVPAVEQIIPAAGVGDLEILNLPVLIVNQNIPGGVDMLLGLDFFRRIHVWISYSSNSLIMQYPPTASPLFGAPAQSSPLSAPHPRA